MSASGRVATVGNDAFSPTRVKRVSSHVKLHRGGDDRDRAWRYMIENGTSKKLDVMDLSGACRFKRGSDANRGS